jgi:hypothetical protein
MATLIVLKPAKRSRKPATETAQPSTYKPPSQGEMLRDAAHRAHRDTVEGWIKGEKSERQVKQSHARLQKVLKRELH